MLKLIRTSISLLYKNNEWNNSEKWLHVLIINIIKY